MILFKFSSLLLSLFLIAFFPLQEKDVSVFMIGDSTMSIKDTNAYPETGWGMPFVYFFDSTVTVQNLAKNGRSTGSFLAEKRWHPVMEQMQPGDYVIIQFGHNDEVETKRTYTTPKEFRTNLEKYVSDTRKKGGKPILLTPMARRKFNDAGKVIGTHDQYAQITRDVAAAMDVPLIDMDKKSQALLQELGVAQSQMLFNWLQPGDHPNYPDGVEDNTHFNELGARMMAQLVLKEMKKMHIPLADKIVSGRK